MRVGLEPVVWQQVGQVGWLSGLAGGRAGGGESEGEFPEEMFQPGPGVDGTEFGAGDDAQENGGSITAGFTAPTTAARRCPAGFYDWAQEVSSGARPGCCRSRELRPPSL